MKHNYDINDPANDDLIISESMDNMYKLNRDQTEHLEESGNRRRFGVVQYLQNEVAELWQPVGVLPQDLADHSVYPK